MKQEQNLRERLPIIYEGERRCGKTENLVKLYHNTKEKTAFIICSSNRFANHLKEEYKIPSNRIVCSNGALHQVMRYGVNLVFLVDEWWLLSETMRNNLIAASWMGKAEVTGFGTLDDRIRIKEFNKNFQTNPNLTTEEMNEYLRMLLGD
jgi:hypothetical protein